MALADDADWVAVCTAQGMRWVSAQAEPGAEAPSPTEQATAHFERCPWCSLASQAMAPPPALSPALRLTPQRQGPAPRFLSAARTAHVWRAAQARAPPQVS